MNFEELKEQWLHEERIAHIHGWDFSHIQGRWEEGNGIPWDYETIVRSHLFPNSNLLDIDTGGGELLLSLNHPSKHTSATEGYPPKAIRLNPHVHLLGTTINETALPIGY